jgi:hypothetical protein
MQSCDPWKKIVPFMRFASYFRHDKARERWLVRLSNPWSAWRMEWNGRRAYASRKSRHPTLNLFFFSSRRISFHFCGRNAGHIYDSKAPAPEYRAGLCLFDAVCVMDKATSFFPSHLGDNSWLWKWFFYSERSCRWRGWGYVRGFGTDYR